MKKTAVSIIISVILLSVFTTPIYALSEEQSNAIQSLLDDASHKSGVPGISISILRDNEAFYFSTGYADREKGLPASENTLYELASVSKAFTGAGILLLEERGLLSMSDPVQKYLPWFTLNYQGNPVDMENLTLDKFLYHTSGLTNAEHIQNIPQGNTPDMLTKTVKMLAGADLTFLPGTEYNYGTVNYDILGLVIEIVSGQSYEEYMNEQIFQPLGLYQTYVYKEEAQATGQLAQGYRSFFFMTLPYNAPEFGGNKPAGYIISSTKDMARWMSIQLDLAQGIPEAYRTVIKKSHLGNMSVPDINGMYYAAGWEVNAEKSIIEHAGVNPNYVTEVIIFPNEQTAICLLSNGTNTNIELVNNIKEIMDGNLIQSYKISNTQLANIILSSAAMIACLLSILFFSLGLRRKKMKRGQVIEKKIRFTVIPWLIFTIIAWIVCLIFPTLAGYTWQTLLVWQSYSTLIALISFALMSTSITWFVYTRP